MGPSKTIGIVAGGGSLPLEVARSITGRSDRVHVILVEGAADDVLKSYPHTVVNWAEFGRAARALEAAGVQDVVFLGKYTRPNLTSAKPNLDLVFALPKLLKILRAGGDDAVLRGLLALFEGRGFRVAGAAEVAPQLIVGEGALTRAKPETGDDADIAKGLAVVAALGRHDIGQGVVVSGGIVEAIEGAEGTDRMMMRVAEARGSMSRERHGVLVKRPKPGQDMRVDMPAIGPATINNARDAGLAGVAVQAGQVLAAERAELVGIADQAGLFVAGVRDVQVTAAPRLNTAERIDIVINGRIKASPQDKAGSARGAAILSDLADFSAGTAVVVRDKRVLAIGAVETGLSVVTRVAEMTGRDRKRRGVAVVRSGEVINEAFLNALVAANLSGVAVLSSCARQALELSPEIFEIAQLRGLFVATVRATRREPL